MRRRIIEHDWASTSLGSIGGWPPALCVVIDLILSSPLPMLVCWGPDRIRLYNDAYRPVFGPGHDDLTALGLPAGEEQPPGNGREQQVLLYRNGRKEISWWKYNHTPVIDGTGAERGILIICIENTEKQLQHQRLQETEQQLGFAIEAAELGTWDYNPITGRFSANNRLKSWFGFARTDEIDLSLAIGAMLPADRGRVTSAIEHALQYASGGNFDIQYTIAGKFTSEERIVRAKGRVWFNNDQVAWRFNGTLQDVTEQEMANSRLQQAQEGLTRLIAQRTVELQRSNDDLLQFAHVISHDLKEPVRKIKIFTGRVADEIGELLSPQALIYLDKIQNAASRMSTMIEGVLNLSSLNASTEHAAITDINTILRQIQEDLEVLILQKNAEIHAYNLPAVHGFPVLIYQLFYNLVNNSLKFVRPDIPPQITVIVSGFPRGFVQFSVIDNGIGFDPIYANRIFDSFARLNSKDSYEGTGLGLALCKKIVERHDGSITATGIPGKGATFLFTLPAASGT
jgi:signal transduction histidine kinase